MGEHAGRSKAPPRISTLYRGLKQRYGSHWSPTHGVYSWHEPLQLFKDPSASSAGAAHGQSIQSHSVPQHAGQSCPACGHGAGRSKPCNPKAREASLPMQKRHTRTITV